MKRAPSLRSRLLVLVGGGLLALLLAQYISMVLMISDHEDEIVDSVLSEQMQYSMHLYQQAGQAPQFHVPHVNFYVFRASKPDANIPLEFLRYGPGNHEIKIGQTEYHLVVHDEKGMRFLLSYDVQQYEDRIEALLALMGLAFVFSAILAVYGIHWLSGRALRNLTNLAEAVHKQEDAPFSREGMEAEVGALATALDDYRARQTLILERERDFSGHLSHELRTPLSVVRARAEVLGLQYPEDRRLQQSAGEIIAAADRMRNMIEQLLRLARRTRAPQRERVKLNEMIDRIWRDLAQTGNSQTSLQNHVPLAAFVFADPLLLELILRNALANARQHADGAELHVDFDAQQLLIEDYSAGHVVLPLSMTEEGEGLGLVILRQACSLLGWSCQITTLPTGTRIALHMSQEC